MQIFLEIAPSLVFALGVSVALGVILTASEPRVNSLITNLSDGYQSLVRRAEVRDAEQKLRDKNSWWFKRRKY